MKIVIFGATGIVGKQLIKLALFKEYNVVAYGRNVHELIEEKERNENLQLIKGGLFDKSDIKDATKNADIILSAIGGNNDVDDHTRSLGMKNIIAAMQQNKIQRIVALGGIGCLKNGEGIMLIETEDFPEDVKAVTMEHLKALQYLQDSKLEWTFVCPQTIIDADVTGLYKTNNNFTANLTTINAGDIAQFMLLEAIKKEYLSATVQIGN
jgi:uncharacterized protein